MVPTVDIIDTRFAAENTHDIPAILATYTSSDSSCLATNNAGQQVALWRYDAFGNLAYGTPDSPFGYSGQYTDASTGFSNLRSRFYDTQTGGFTTRDPAFASADTAYTYAGDDPVNGSDPLGLSDSDPFNGSFWTGGNCLSGLIGSRDGGGGESVGGVVSSVAGLAGAAAAVTAVVATGGIAAGAYSATDVAVPGTAVYEGDTAMGTAISVETVDSSAATAANVASRLGFGAGSVVTTVDCLSAVNTTCFWDAATTLMGAGAGYWPGGFPGALIGIPTLMPSPFSSSSYSSKTGWKEGDGSCQ